MKAAKPRVAVVKKVKAPVSDAWIVKVAGAALPGAVGSSLTVVLTGDAEVRQLNRRYRGKDKTTDVLSFPMAGNWPGSGGERGQLGDIVVSIPQARRQAKAAGARLKAELARLLVHGCLHLTGFDHELPKDAKVMLPLQDRILKGLGL